MVPGSRWRGGACRRPRSLSKRVVRYSRRHDRIDLDVFVLRVVAASRPGRRLSSTAALPERPAVTCIGAAAGAGVQDELAPVELGIDGLRLGRQRHALGASHVRRASDQQRDGGLGVRHATAFGDLGAQGRQQLVGRVGREQAYVRRRLRPGRGSGCAPSRRWRWSSSSCAPGMLFATSCVCRSWCDSSINALRALVGRRAGMRGAALHHHARRGRARGHQQHALVLCHRLGGGGLEGQHHVVRVAERGDGFARAVGADLLAPD